MRSPYRIGSLTALLLLALGGCSGGFEDDPHRMGNGDDDDDDDGPPIGDFATVCPVDPDCSMREVADCTPTECPGYFVCQEFENETKVCKNPGPDYPDDMGGWECVDYDGSTFCRRDASQPFPDEGSSGEWNCQVKAEFVVCENETPDYPSDGDGSEYNCYFAMEQRVCESGPNNEGDWFCVALPDGRQQCRDNTPQYPDDRNWMCLEDSGRLVCTTPEGDVPQFPDNGNPGEYNCEKRAEFVICTSETPPRPPPSIPVPSAPGEEPNPFYDRGSPGEYNCEYTSEFVICTERGEGDDDDDDDMVPFDGGDLEGRGCPYEGLTRWCDSELYCSWGKQVCTNFAPAGEAPSYRFGPCMEVTLDAATGIPDRPNERRACYYFYFNPDVCEDQQDRDMDGFADCYFFDSESNKTAALADPRFENAELHADVPVHTSGPSCDYEQTYCGACDPYNVPDSTQGICLIRNGGHNDLQTFYTPSCSTNDDCSMSTDPAQPPAAQCRNVATADGNRKVCVPVSNSCITDTYPPAL